MTTADSLGIFMDHANAHLMEFTTDPIATTTITSDFTNEERIDSLGKSEHVMHNKEKHELLAYFKKLAEKILHYKEVLLFGPTDAKVELFNMLKGDHRFDAIKIVVKNSDKIIEHQQHVFVKNYFQDLNRI